MKVNFSTAAVGLSMLLSVSLTGQARAQSDTLSVHAPGHATSTQTINESVPETSPVSAGFSGLPGTYTLSGHDLVWTDSRGAVSDIFHATVTPGAGGTTDVFVSIMSDTNGGPILSAPPGAITMSEPTGVVDITSQLFSASPAGFKVAASSDNTCIPNTTSSARVTAVLSGPPGQMVLKIQDAVHGVASITVLQAANATMDSPIYSPGTKSPILLTATKINQQMPSHVALEVIPADDAICPCTCDPVFTRLEIPVASPSVSQTFTGLSKMEGLITVRNGDNGLQGLSLQINRRKPHLLDMRPRPTLLRDQNRWVLDLSGEMIQGNANTLTLTAYGLSGASAQVVAADTFADLGASENPPKPPLSSPSRGTKNRSRRNIDW